MHILKIGVAIFLLTLFFTSCKQQVCVEESLAKNGGKTIKTRVNRCKDNVIIYEQEYDTYSDSLVAQGFLKQYYDNGKMKSLAYYKKGVQDSVEIEYYENGQIKAKKFRAYGTVFGPQYAYHSDGKVGQIDYYTKDGKNWLTLGMNKMGAYDGFKGRLLHVTLVDKDFDVDSVPVHTTLYLINEVPSLLHKNTILNIKIRKQNAILTDTTYTRFTGFLNTVVSGFKYKFEKKGVYELLSTVNIIDSASNSLVCTDTLLHSIKVY